MGQGIAGMLGYIDLWKTGGDIISLSNTAPVLKQYSINSKPTTMEAEKILGADLLDLVFEHKNKSYGAYSLRKFYSKRLYLSLGLMLAAVMVFSAFTLLPGKQAVAELQVNEHYMQTLAPGKPKEPLPQKQPETATQVVAQNKWISNIRIEKERPVDSLNTLDSNARIGSIRIVAPVGVRVVAGVPPGPGDPGDPGPAEPPLVQPEPAVPDPSVPMEHPDVAPDFPGGTKALAEFMRRHLRNPRELEEEETVLVRVKFVVGYDGKLKSFEIVRDGGAEFNQEVIRVLKKMPDWIPGKNSGKQVSAMHTMQVRFVVQE